MTHEAIQADYPKREGNPVAPNISVSPELRASQEKSVNVERQHFLGVLATGTVVAIGVASNTELQKRVAKSFIKNVERYTPDALLADREALALQLIASAEGLVKTETAAALKSQNQLLVKQIEDLTAMLAEQGHSAEIMKELAPFLKKPVSVAIDTSEFSRELVMPTTDELEESLTHLTDETVSPPRGVALESAIKTGRSVLNLVWPMKRLSKKQ